MDNNLATRPIVVQACIDVQSVEEALDVAHMAVRAGVDWLEVGTPLILFWASRRSALSLPPFPAERSWPT